MSQFIQGTVLQDHLAEHPAVQAWHRLGVADPTPASVVILKEHKKHKGRSKSAVYRLSGLGSDGSSIVAKRCRRQTAALECHIYENILSQLPLTTLRYHGCAADADDGYRWLFIEDAGGEPFSRSRRSHREAAVRWLAVMHTAAPKVAGVDSLPARDTDHYFECLESAGKRIADCLQHAFLGHDDRRVLDILLSQIDLLLSKWDVVTAICLPIPKTLAHGDFAEKNLCVRWDSSESTILPFDWEMAGHGVPVADLYWLSASELAAYRSIVCEAWSDMKGIELESLSNAAKVFRFAVRINWSAMSLLKGCTHNWVDRPMRELTLYAERLERLLSTALRSKS